MDRTLKILFGNESAARILLHLFHYSELHASAIAADYGVSVYPILQQLNRFEKTGLLSSKYVGRSRLFSFNKKSFLFSPVMMILKGVYYSMSLSERQTRFKIRRRPRAKGKTVL